MDMENQETMIRLLSQAQSSTFDPEKLNAFNLACALLEGHGLGWKDVIKFEVKERIQAPEDAWIKAVDYCLKHDLRDEERGFLQSIRGQLLGGRELTEKQEEWFQSIYMSLS